MSQSKTAMEAEVEQEWHAELRKRYLDNTLEYSDDETDCPTCGEVMAFIEGKVVVKYACEECGYSGEMPVKPDE